MTRLRTAFLALAGLASLLILLPVAARADNLRAGAATSNITPELGEPIIGGFVPFPSKYVHDELHARCLVLDDGQTRLVLVVCDLLGIHQVVSDEARRLIQERSGIPPEQVLVCGTHTHSASSALGRDRLKYEQTPDDYQKFVARRIADGVARAVHDLRPAELAFGTAEAPEHVFNRRWSMRPGTMPENPFGGTDLVKMNPPAGSENLVQPAGPTDPVVSFLAVRELDGPPISVFASYSLHYVGGVGDGHVSADYFAVFSEELARLLDADRQQPPFVAMLSNGTSGDINNINFRQPRGRKQPYEQMEYVGRDVAAKVHAALEKLEYRSDVPLAARYRLLPVAWRKPDAEMRQWAERTLAAGPQSPRDLSYIYAQRVTGLAGFPETAEVPLQVLRIGDVCIGTMPCEVFCEIGLEFKRRSPRQPAFLVSLAHGYLGYLPTPRQHELGGYETWLGTNRLEKQASVKMLDALLQMAEDF
ncbi:MAG: neutral/alkaline non-lysosomal ceramidase N-terminal domain-containing protein [Pirellulaceae bacterium]|nr:neutral/alkaline non-lysosomal ceramidase N-terminal domain-containing protein [Pirellulaceae bacterium]